MKSPLATAFLSFSAGLCLSTSRAETPPVAQLLASFVEKGELAEAVALSERCWGHG